MLRGRLNCQIKENIALTHVQSNCSTQDGVEVNDPKILWPEAARFASPAILTLSPSDLPTIVDATISLKAFRLDTISFLQLLTFI